MIEHPTDLPRRPRRVAIGNFDGVHQGHAAIIRGCDTVLTFDPHPLAVVAPGREPKLLTSLRTRAELVGRLGVRELVVVTFGEEVARQSAEGFVDETLIARLGAVHVSVGENFHYGARGAGDVRSLRARTEFTTAVADLVRVDGRPVSSTRIREAVEAGEVEQAARLLGRPHRLLAQVGDDSRSGLGAGPGGVRLALQPWDVRPAPGRYVCSLAAAGSDGPRVVRAVEVLTPRRPEDGGHDGPGARVLGSADESWAHELSVDFLRVQPARPGAPRELRVLAVG